MKKIALVTTLSAGLVFASHQAAALDTQSKQELTALGTIAVATVAAGPVGFLAGAFGGSWLAGQIADADNYEEALAELQSTRAELDTKQRQLAQLNGQLEAVRADQSRLAAMALEQLQLEVLFKTGVSQLTEAGEKRLALLADFLTQNPDLNVAIEGFADPRGDSATNMRLSQARAQAVANALRAVGVPRERMTVLAHGEQKSQAPAGDVDAYALERRVRIELNRSDSGPRVAGVVVGELR